MRFKCRNFGGVGTICLLRRVMDARRCCDDHNPHETDGRLRSSRLREEPGHTEHMVGLLAEAGYGVSTDENDAAVVVVNT